MPKARERFKYTAPSVADIKDVRDASGYAFNSLTKPEAQLSNLKHEASNLVRLLPATWEGARYVAFPMWVHYNIGPDRDAYLCTEEMAAEYERAGLVFPGEDPPRCAACDARRAAREAGEEKLADDLRSTRRWAAYVINRSAPDDGVLFWSVPHTVNKGLAGAMMDDNEEGVLPITDIDSGYDFSFSKEGSGLKTKYSAMTVARRPTPLSTRETDIEKWLSFVLDHPIPNVLQFYPYSEIQRALQGKSTRPTEDEQQAQRDDTQRVQVGGAPSAEPIQSTDEPPAPVRENVEVTAEQINAMSRRELITFVRENGLPMDPDGYEDKTDLATAVITGLGLNKAATPPPETITEPQSAAVDVAVEDKGGQSRLELLRQRHRQQVT